MGNSEVGHLNIGAGRVVEQDLSRINRELESGSISSNPAFTKALGTLLETPERALHLIGLLSRGGVHSIVTHAEALARAAARAGVKRIFIHAISDGRDRPPQAAMEEILACEKMFEQIKAATPGLELGIATVCGRYYAMDRDKRWERTQIALDALCGTASPEYASLKEGLESAYQKGETDEFIKPFRIALPQSNTSRISEGDTLLFFNFRADRMRQIVRAFLNEVPECKPLPKAKTVLTLCEYEEDLKVEVLFRPQVLKNYLGEVLAKYGLKQLRIAETEKYAHVTYFFNAGVEEPLMGEERVLVPSPRDVATYDLKPEMSAREVTAILKEKILARAADVYILNFANCDMVGHSGKLEAAIKAVETVDSCLGEILDALDSLGGRAVITADHGNADQMLDYQTGEPHTFHTMHPVPFILSGPGLNDLCLKPDGALSDIAPTILEILELPQPAEMSGKSLIKRC